MKKTSRFCLAILVISTSSPALGQADFSSGDLGFDVFVGACAGNIGRPEATLSYLHQHGFSPAPPAFAEGQFHTSADNVWLAPLPNRIAVVTQSDALKCSTYVRGGDSAKESSIFTKLVLGIARPTVWVRKVKDEDLATARGTAHYVGYRVGAASPSPGTADRLFSVTTASQDDAAFSTIMTVAAVKAGSD